MSEFVGKATWYLGAAIVVLCAAVAVVLMAWNLFLASGRMNGRKVQGEVA